MSKAGIRVFVLLAGMAFAIPAMAWKIVAEGQRYTHKASGYSIQYPADWRYEKYGDFSFATRDGPCLQRIYVDFRKHKKAFRALDKDATPEMMPQELAEKIVAEMEAAGSLQNMEVLSNEPTTLAGRPAFRVHVSFRTAVDAGSVRYEGIVVGTNSPQGIFLIGYSGSVFNYFARDVDTYDKTLATFAVAELKRAR
ncbi:MAG: hypothetical protein HW417_238 [Steroidobacteraceae bacterium]|nr:hypothetical protein [Steroidobacteraceae bacterium]